MSRPTHTDLASQRVPEALAGSALDAVVRALWGVSWGEARRWIERGKVKVNGEVWTDERRKVGPNAEVTFSMNAPKPRGETALARDAFVYLDGHLVVVNKPAGVSTIPYDEHETGTLDERVRSELQRREPKGERGTRPSLGIVHRIDKETSGLVVFTRTWLAKQSLSTQFREHTVHRRYLALVHGAPSITTIRSHLVPNRGDGLRGSRRRGDEGQLAITHLELLERFGLASLVACRLETGRTHQIRIHLSEAGCPLLGERVYVRGWGGESIPAPRMMLHAAELGFVHPVTEQEMRFEIEPPEDFTELLERLRGAGGAR